MGKTSREFGWRRSNTELIRIFFQTVPKTIKIDPDYWKIYSSPSIYTREVSYTSLETAVNKLSWNACFLSKKKETTSLNAFKLTLISIKYHLNLNCELSDTQIIQSNEAKINLKGSLLYGQHLHKNWLENNKSEMCYTYLVNTDWSTD